MTKPLTPRVKRVRRFRRFKKDWNGYTALPIDKTVLDIAEDMAKRLDTGDSHVQIFPCGRGSLQFESGDLVKGDYFEMEILPNGRASCYLKAADGKMDASALTDILVWLEVYRQRGFK